MRLTCARGAFPHRHKHHNLIEKCYVSHPWDGAILLLDEADSFLRDRSRSLHSWDVSTVNELLQRMERFEDTRGLMAYW